MTAKIHDRISVAAICFSDSDIEELSRRWRAVGARRVSFGTPQLFASDPRWVRAVLVAADQTVATICHPFLLGPWPGKDADPEPARAGLMRAIDVAVTLDCPSIYMSTGGRGPMSWQEAADFFAAAVAPCQAYARDAGISLMMENTGPLDAAIHIGNNLADALAAAEIAGMRMCIDIFSCWTERTLFETFKRAIPICDVFQFADYVYGDRSLPNRAVPGDGAIPLRTVVERVLAEGFTGTFDLEMMGPRIDAEGQVEAVRRSVIYMSHLLTELGA